MTSPPQIIIPDNAEKVLENMEYHVNHRIIGPALQAAPATLRATYAENGRTTPWLLTTSACESILYVTRNADFRSYLACIRRMFIDGNVYGGEATRHIQYAGQHFIADFQMTNTRQQGFALTIHTRRAA